MKKIVLLLSLIFVVFSCFSVLASEKVKVYAEVDKPMLLVGRDERVVIRVALSPVILTNDRGRLSFNSAIVLDKSGSMASDNKIYNAKLGAIEVLNRLTNDDIFSVVVYDSTASVYIPARRVNDVDLISRMINAITADGNTALYDGVVLGGDEVMKNINRNMINRIILLSDGLANVGPDSTQELARLGKALRQKGISVSTIGVGLDYNEDLMTALAKTSGGNAYFAKDGAQLPRIFAEETGEAMTLTARAIRIRVECYGDAIPVSIIGREGVIDGRNMQVEIDNLYGKNEKYALFEINVPMRKNDDRIKAARVMVDFKDPFTNDIVTWTEDVDLRSVSDIKMFEESQNRKVISDTALTKVSEIKDKAVELSDKGDYKEASKILGQMSTYLGVIASESDNPALFDEESEKLKQLSVGLIETGGMTNYQRKMVVNEAYTQSNQQYYVSSGDISGDVK